MANIRKYKDKLGKTHYHVQIRLKGYPPQTAAFDRITDAKKWIQETEADIRHGRHFKTSAAKKHTLKQLIERYISNVLPQKRSAKSQRAQLLWWKNVLGALLLADITPSIIADKRDELLKAITPRKKKRAPATVVRYLAVLSHVFSYATKELQWMEDNPVSKIRKPIESRGRVRFLSEDERQELLKACQSSKNEYLYLIVILALSTGMRASEILNLKWSDVDLINKKIVLHQTKNDERRSVPLTGIVLELLKKHAAAKCSHFSLLFPGHKSDRGIDIRSAWETVMKKTGIKNFRFHDLRHDFASSLLAQGASIAQLAEILGHKTLSMVKRYAHLCEGTAREIVGRMTEEVLG